MQRPLVHMKTSATYSILLGPQTLALQPPQPLQEGAVGDKTTPHALVPTAQESLLAQQAIRKTAKPMMCIHSSNGTINADFSFSAGNLCFILQFTELIMANRRMNATNPKHDVANFSESSSTGTLHTHLCSEHIDDWVSSCDSANITIKAKKSQAAIDEYRKSRGQPTSGSNTLPKYFSKEAFVDAIVEFIIADDQVSSFIVLIFLMAD